LRGPGERLETGGPLNSRERLGRAIRRATATLIGAPLALILLVPYLARARAGEKDRRSLYTYSAVTLSLTLLPLLFLLVLHLFFGAPGPH